MKEKLLKVATTWTGLFTDPSISMVFGGILIAGAATIAYQHKRLTEDEYYIDILLNESDTEEISSSEEVYGFVQGYRACMSDINKILSNNE